MSVCESKEGKKKEKEKKEEEKEEKGGGGGWIKKGSKGRMKREWRVRRNK